MQTLMLFFVLVGAQSVAYSQSPTQTIPTYGNTAPNPAQSCIADICGPPAQSNLYITKYSDRLNEYVRLAADPKQIDFSPTIAKLLADIQTENQVQATNAVSIFRKSASLGGARPTGLSKAFYNIIYAAPSLKKIKYKASNTNGKIDVTIDEPASVVALKDLPPADQKWVLGIAKHFMSSYKYGDVSEGDVQTKPAQLLLRQLHPKLSLAEAMKLEIDQAQRKVNSLKDLSPMEKAIFYNYTSPDRIALIAKRVADGTVDENETREILRWNIESKRNEFYYRNLKSPLMTREAPPVEEIIKTSGGFEAAAKSFEDDQVKNQQREDSKIQSCKMQYFINKGLLPTKAQIDGLNIDVKRAKQLVIEMIKSKFPASSQSKLVKAVENAEFITPPSAAEFEKSFEDNLRQKLQLAKATTASMGSIPASEMRQLISIFSFSKTVQESDDSKDTSNSFCGAFNYSPMSDANYTTYGSIILSFTTATGDETSRMKTIMHELGHSISRAIADDPVEADRLRRVRRCLGKQHTEALPTQMKKRYEEAAKTNPKLDTPYAEEDFADAVAIEAGAGLQGRNGWCQFLSLSQDRQQYTESKIQADDGDPHSSSLFRLLNFEKSKKGRLPASCDSYLTSIKFKENFSLCLDHANPKGPAAQPKRTVN